MMVRDKTDLMAMQRQEIRRQILLTLEQSRPQPMTEPLLLRSLQAKHIEVTSEGLRRELDYLIDKKLVANQGKEATWLLTLTSFGVDVVEGSIEAPPGIRTTFADANHQEIERRKEIRWRVLRILDSGRPSPVMEELIWRTLEDASLLATFQEMRRELLYLEGKALIEIQGKQRQEGWLADLTSFGVDVVEYEVDCPPGIGRVEQYW